MTNENKQHPPVDTEKLKKGISENERAGHEAFDRQQQYDDSDDAESSIRETDDPEETDREGGDLAGTAAGNLDDGE